MPPMATSKKYGLWLIGYISVRNRITAVGHNFLGDVFYRSLSSGSLTTSNFSVCCFKSLVQFSWLDCPECTYLGEIPNLPGQSLERHVFFLIQWSHNLQWSGPHLATVSTYLGKERLASKTPSWGGTAQAKKGH